MHAKTEPAPLPNSDLAAFNRLVSVHQGQAFSLACRLLDDAQEAEGVVQESFIRLYSMYDPVEDQFVHLLLQIIVELCHRAQHKPLGSPQRSQLPLVQQPYTNKLETAIRMLDYEERLVLLLSDTCGLTYQEIARITGATPQKVRSSIGQARQSLHSLLHKARAHLPVCELSMT